MMVTLLTDYGVEDEFAGVCRAVILGICPDARIVDITHGIPRYDVRHGAIVLRNAIPYAPVGVHVAIVDPQVGTERRAVALQTADGRLFVGPDNGLLSLAWERSGGVELAVDVSRSTHRLEPVSATFHGRDVFAPVAAHLAAGAELAEAGEPLEPAELARIELPRPRIEQGALVAHVLIVDRFGNLVLDVEHDDLAGTRLTLGRRVELAVGGERRLATYAHSFADVASDELLVYEDASRALAVAVNRGHAADVLGLGPDAELRLRPA
jgi:S-adenosyl-L-methionine hydrolase (adenosine-forming)